MTPIKLILFWFILPLGLLAQGQNKPIALTVGLDATGSKYQNSFGPRIGVKWGNWEVTLYKNVDFEPVNGLAIRKYFPFHPQNCMPFISLRAAQGKLKFTDDYLGMEKSWGAGLGGGIQWSLRRKWMFSMEMGAGSTLITTPKGNQPLNDFFGNGFSPYGALGMHYYFTRGRKLIEDRAWVRSSFEGISFNIYSQFAIWGFKVGPNPMLGLDISLPLNPKLRVEIGPHFLANSFGQWKNRFGAEGRFGGLHAGVQYFPFSVGKFSTSLAARLIWIHQDISYLPKEERLGFQFAPKINYSISQQAKIFIGHTLSPDWNFFTPAPRLMGGTGYTEIGVSFSLTKNKPE